MWSRINVVVHDAQEFVTALVILHGDWPVESAKLYSLRWSAGEG
jgi:hypothetical protein